jgi:hypothetical protein
MSGIPVYTQSPLNAPKPSGVTPQTAAPRAQPSSLTPSSVPATATTAPTSSYPPAQPVAAAFPGPTAAAQRYAPVQPTPTTKVGDEGPLAPQPGATPLNRNPIPPPPKAGESYRSSQETGAALPSPAIGQPYPPQMGIPPPTTTYGAQPPSSSTGTTTTASASYPVTISAEYGAPRRSLEHPPGYHQNVYASEPTSDQRRAREANVSSGIGAQDISENAGGMDILNTAKKWAQQAGGKLSEVEAEVWRKINKE